MPLPRSISNCRLRPRHRRTMACPWVLFGLVAEQIAGVGQEEEVQGDRRLGQHVRCQSHSFGTRPRGQTCLLDIQGGSLAQQACWLGRRTS